MISKPVFVVLGVSILALSLYNAYILTRIAKAGQQAGEDVNTILGTVRRAVTGA